jgi:RNA polymerase sigma-70 factor (ECF subfamily)
LSSGTGNFSTATHRGDDADRWVQEHGDYLFRFAILRVRNRETAEDLVQETLLAAWRGRDRRDGSSSERTWLTAILKHKIADHFRKLGRETPFTDLSFCDGEFSEKFLNRFWDHAKGPLAWGEDATGAADAADFREVLGLCLGKLPDHVAAAFTMREIDDVAGQEICGLLHVTQSNLWTMLHRARMALRECLERNWFATP